MLWALSTRIYWWMPVIAEKLIKRLPNFFFFFFFASQLHTTEAKCQSLERKERKTFNLRLEWEWLYLRQGKKCWLSSWIRLLLHFYFSLHKEKRFKCSKSKLNFNELCLIVKITKNSVDWLSNIMIHVCSGFWETQDIDANVFLFILFWLQFTEITIC